MCRIFIRCHLNSSWSQRFGVNKQSVVTNLERDAVMTVLWHDEYELLGSRSRWCDTGPAAVLWTAARLEADTASMETSCICLMCRMLAHARLSVCSEVKWTLPSLHHHHIILLSIPRGCQLWKSNELKQAQWVQSQEDAHSEECEHLWGFLLLWGCNYFRSHMTTSLCGPPLTSSLEDTHERYS